MGPSQAPPGDGDDDDGFQLEDDAPEPGYRAHIRIYLPAIYSTPSAMQRELWELRVENAEGVYIVVEEGTQGNDHGGRIMFIRDGRLVEGWVRFPDEVDVIAEETQVHTTVLRWWSGREGAPTGGRQGAQL